MSREAFDAYRRGVAEAMAEVGAGEPSVYVFGLNPPGGVDRASGLPYKVVARDAVAPLIVWRVRGHNEAIGAYFAKN